MKFVFPWPSSKLSPNARQHWGQKAKAVKDARHLAGLIVFAQLETGLREARASVAGKDRIDVTITFYPPDNRRRDDDNMIAAFKSCRDGIADALGVDDRAFRPVYRFEDAAKPGRVEVAL